MWLCNLGSIKLQASAVSNIHLKRMWSLGWLQGPFAYLVTNVAPPAGILSLSLTFVDLLLTWNFAESGSQPFPPPFFGKYGVRWVFSTKFLQCDSASWRMHAGVVLTRRVAMDTSLICLRCSGSCPTFKVARYSFFGWIQKLKIIR